MNWFTPTAIGVPEAPYANMILEPRRSTTFVDAYSAFGNASVFATKNYICPQGQPCATSRVAPLFAIERTRAPSGGQVWDWVQIGKALFEEPPFGQADALADIDGDGLSDRRRITSRGDLTCGAKVYFSDYGRSGVATPLARRSTCSNMPNLDSERRKLLHERLADMNGDGFADLVSFWETYATHRMSVSFFAGDGTGSFTTEVGVSGGEAIPLGDFASHYVYTVDVNGDGLSDIMYPVLAEQRFAVLVNHGDNGFGPALSLPIPESLRVPPGRPWQPEPQFGDFDGDGAQDVLLLGPDHSYARFRQGPPDHLLVSVDNGLGARTKLTYESTTTLDVLAKKAGIPWETHVPRPTYVVTERTDSVRSLDGGERATVTRFDYRDPAWDGRRGGGLRGFRTVTRSVAGDARDPGTSVACHAARHRTEASE
ncbi:MAG: hypothetical protein EOP08_09805, partial [Proteobacteria bacterium]